MVRKIKKKVKVFFFILLLLLLSIRFIIEFNYVEKQYEINLNSRPVDLTHEQVVEDELSKRFNGYNHDRYWEGRDYGRYVDYYFNENGFRIENESDIIIKDGIKKKNIVFLGDSFTEGQFLNYNETITYLFENKINHSYNTYNLGFRGFDSDDEIIILKKYSGLYNPKIIVWQWFLNDYSDYYYENIALKNTFKQKKILFYWPLYLHKQKKVFAIQKHEDLTDFFDTLISYSNENNFTFIFLMYPVMKEKENFAFGYYNEADINTLNNYYQDFKNYVLKNNQYLIEVNKSLPDYDYQDDKFVVIPNDPHPSLYANKLVTEVLYDFMINKSLFNK